MLSDADNKRFWSKVSMKEPTGCWEWQGACSGFGHGRFKLHGVLVSPHRIAYEMAYGPLLNGQWVLHRCDNPRCVNPFHLFEGDRSANMQDCAAKGRLAVQKDPSFTQGENRPNSKLTDDLVRDIREAAARGKKISHIAKQRGMSRSIIQRVVNRTRWAHVA